MSETIELDDLVYDYPKYNEEEIQTEITRKFEFLELAGLRSEPVPKRGQLYRHQKLFLRLMRQYDSQLVMSETGTGKLCQYVGTIQYYKMLADTLDGVRRLLEESEIKVSDPLSLKPQYKRAYVLVKGQSLIDETKNQILCKCTDGEYITPQILNSKTETARKQNITRSISKFYTITTYGVFAKELFEKSDEQLRNEFDNCIFVVDEVHNIKDDKSGGQIRYSSIGNKYYVQIRKNRRTQKVEEHIIENRLIYDQLWRLFHLVKPRKVMLLSATPSINDPSEIGPRLNLILPADRQIPEDVNWNTVTLDYLEPYFRGLISFVRALDTGAIPIYQGKAIQAEYSINPENKNSPKVPAQIVIYATEMAEKQLKVYDQAVANPLSLRPESDKPEAFDDLKRQAANFVFPDDSTGSVGYRKYVIEEKNNVFKATTELRAWLKSRDHFRAMSAKFYEIVKLCSRNEGNCWCYSHYIRGSGAVVLGLCFDANGFERYEEKESVFSFCWNRFRCSMR